MTENLPADQTQLEAEVRARLAQAGLAASPEQIERLVRARRHMRARLAELRGYLDHATPPALTFPSTAAAWQADAADDD